MSSSSIIKQEEGDATPLPGFNLTSLDRKQGQHGVNIPDDSQGFIPMEHYRSVTEKGPTEVTLDDSQGFIPMEIFDPVEQAEIAARQEAELAAGLETTALEEEAVPEEPPGITLKEEELEQRLRESYESGLQDGKNLAERGLLHVFKSLRTATEDIVALREKVLRESEDDLLKLIIMVARKLILREVSLDRSILVEVVRGALEHVSDRAEVTLRLNPDDFTVITLDNGELFRQGLQHERLSLKQDASILPGSCQIESDMGIIDAGFDGQLEEIYRRLVEERILSTEQSP